MHKNKLFFGVKFASSWKSAPIGTLLASAAESSAYRYLRCYP